MLIDWFTVIAQVINFLILVWLLKRFLYRPILDAIDARERRIGAALAQAEAQKTAAEQERAAFARRNAEFDQQRTVLLNQATDAAKAERLRLLDAARGESDRLRAQWRETLVREQQSSRVALTRCARDEVFAIARKALTDLAGADLEERMADVFVRRLRASDETVLTGLKAAFKSSSGPLRVQTVFSLPPGACAAIETALSDTLDEAVRVQFETAPELVSGIEISGNGYRVAWSLADYLTALDQAVDALLKESPASAVKSD
jgi:F-type H+-transporting ATPase subunit b